MLLFNGKILELEECLLFNSIEYIFLFVPLTMIVYFFLNKNHLVVGGNVWLVGASLFFYGYLNPTYLLPLIITSICFNFAVGNSLNNGRFKSKISKKALLIFGIVCNLLLLGYFKYMDFFINNVNELFHSDLSLLHIALPLGISFFTFTQSAYLFDSYYGKTKEYDFLNYTLFVAFYPHLVAGPIIHHSEMMPQFARLKNKLINYENIISGIFLFTIGLFKKVIIADTFSLYVNSGYSAPSLSFVEGWIVSIAYTFQIFFDFSGYTDMALGVAKMFNINLPINFNSPYKAISVQDFWRRWHMTLSRFLRDYVYIPLGGNRISNFRTYVNTLIVFFLCGLWHGASWMFVIWGMIHGMALCINRFWSNVIKIQIPKALSIAMTFLFVNFAWIFFRAKNMHEVSKVVRAMFGLSGFLIPKISHFNFFFEYPKGNVIYENSIILLIFSFILVFAAKNSNELINIIKIKSKKQAVIFSVIFSILFALAVIKMNYVPHSEFIYFNF